MARYSRLTIRTVALIAVGLCVLLGGLATAGAAADAGPAVASPAIDAADERAGLDAVQFGQLQDADDGSTDDTNADAHADVRNPQPPIEDEYLEEAPERGDEYFEAMAADGRWISYKNPRDRYRNPYLGEGSGKICMTLVNEEGETIVGETVPNTTVTIPTSDSIDWHSYTGPMTVDLPLTDNYERPYDADQFGTSDLPQGDGYMDSHCIEVHGMPEDGGYVGYDEPQIDGEYADWIDVVGYVQTQDTWDSDIDPIEAAESYEEAGGGWTYAEGDSHGQVVIVLQLDPPEDAYPEDDGAGADDGTDAEDEAESNESDTDSSDTETAAESDEGSEMDTGSGPDSDSDSNSETETTDSSDSSDGRETSANQMPGFGAFAAVVALAIAALASARGRR